jgi:hypothetical protein
LETSDTELKPAKNVLLAGAGFTRDYGGYLGGEMWARILSQPEVRDSPLRGILLGDESLNYEALYNSIRDRGDSEVLFPKLTVAINNVYGQMDREIAEKYISQVSICEFIRCYVPTNKNERGFFFTLNQDLFVERFFTSYTADGASSQVEIPGLHSQTWFRHNIDPLPMVRLRSEQEVKNIEREFNKKSVKRLSYMKLHGSYNWSSRDGSAGMVIGTTKDKMIEREPLLKWYFDLFKSVLSLPERNLLVIGYSFCDGHINKVITDAIEKNGLQLFVVSPISPNEFRRSVVPSRMMASIYQRSTALWDGLRGYYQATVLQLFGNDEIIPPQGMELIRTLGLR